VRSRAKVTIDTGPHRTTAVGKKRDAGVTTGNKREYKMWDLIATTARRHERDADDVLFDEGSPSVVLSK